MTDKIAEALSSYREGNRAPWVMNTLADAYSEREEAIQSGADLTALRKREGRTP